MLSCRGRTPPPQLQLPHTCGQRAGAVPAPAHLQLHLTAASSPAGQTVLGSILIESQYPSYILKPSPVSESPTLLSVTPHFIPSSTQSPGTAHCHNILLFLHRKNPFCDFQSCPAHFPETTNHKTQRKVCDPHSKSFIYTEAGVQLRERTVRCHRLTRHTGSRQARKQKTDKKRLHTRNEIIAAI